MYAAPCWRRFCCVFSGCGVQSEPEQLSLFAMDTYMTLAAYGDKASGGPGRLRSGAEPPGQGLSRTREEAKSIP